MKAGCYLNVRGGVKRFEESLKKYDDEIELIQFDCYPSIETVSMLKDNGCEAMVYTPTKMLGDDFWKTAADSGLKYVVTCSAGYDHFNLEAMKKYGLKGANVPVYSPNAIAEHAVMLTLSILRNYRKQILNIQDGFVENGKKEVYQYGTVCSNSGFLGNPIAEGVFGTTGLVYASIFLIPQRIVMWSAGVSFFSKEENRAATYKKVLTHPCMIATYIGMLIMIFNLKIPMFINGAVTALSNCTTAMTMVYVGTILVDINIKKLINRQQIYFSFIRLVVMPLIVYVGCYLAHIDSLITGVCVLLTGMPAGSTTSLLASKYGADEDSAAQSVVFTTILSIISIPIWSAILLNNI